MNNKISVIMSVYNEKEVWLREAIDSILAQTFKEFEFIIILDNPKNKLAIDILKEYEKVDKRIRVYINEENIGLVKSLNKAIGLCNNEFIARMDADDYSYSERFEKQVRFLSRNPSIDLCATGVIIMNEDGNELYKAKIYGTTSKKAEKSIIYRNIFPHGSWMVRKSSIDKVGLYNKIEQAEDYDLLFRMLINKMKIVVLPEYLFKYRLRVNGISYKNLYKQKIIMLEMSKQYLNAIKFGKKYEFVVPKINEEKNMEKYFYYQNLYTESITNIRNKNIIKGINKIIKVLVFSQYKRKEIRSAIALKFIDKIYR